jgi:phosphoglycerate kinase
MLEFVDKMIIGGAMANTFLNSQGIDTKGSTIESDLLSKASEIIDHAKNENIDIYLPQDLVCAEKFDNNTPSKCVLLSGIPDQWMALDIGPKTAQNYAHVIQNAGTIVWNGPMGVFEMDQFLSGTKTIADAIASSSAFSIVGGGDTGLAAKKCGVADKVSYISTGGGAFLHLMEGKKLPGVVALE